MLFMSERDKPTAKPSLSYLCLGQVILQLNQAKTIYVWGEKPTAKPS